MMRNILFSLFFFSGIILISIIFLPSLLMPQKIVLFGSGSDPKLCATKGENVIIIKKKNINAILPEEIFKLI